jgi:CHAD domain-containing protein
VGCIHDQRRQAQKPIRQTAAQFDKKRYKRRARRLVKKLLKADRKQKAASTFGQLAHDRMRALVDEFFAYGTSQLRDLETLHRFRVCGKNLRYAMEVFAGAFRRSFREELYRQIEALQDQLGKINDHSVARAHYERWLADAKDEARRALLQALIAEEAAAIGRLHDEFLQEWTPERAAGLRQRFLQELNSEEEQRAVAVG